MCDKPLTACRSTFLGDAPQPWILPITSVNESRLLKELGLPKAEHNQIVGLRIRHVQRVSGASNIWGFWLTEQQISSRAIVRLANNPPPGVGRLQRLTSQRLLRPFPLGLRLSGKNMSYAARTRTVAVGFAHVESNDRCSDPCTTGHCRAGSVGARAS
eukprot:1786886-Prymnesium_polylepis.2